MTASTSAPRPTTGDRRTTRWETAAAHYDAWFDTPWGAYASSIEHHLLLAGIPPLAGATVLDAGCGTARFMARLETSGADVTGLDQDLAALHIARSRVRGSLIAGDVHQLPFGDHHFDATFAVTVCEFTDPTTTIAELVRVTRPAGHIVIGSINPHSPWGWRMRRRFRQPPWNQATFLRLRPSNGGFGVLTITPPDATPPGTTPADTDHHDPNQETPCP